jgi:hypothetical protein
MPTFLKSRRNYINEAQLRYPLALPQPLPSLLIRESPRGTKTGKTKILRRKAGQEYQTGGMGPVSGSTFTLSQAGLVAAQDIYAITAGTQDRQVATPVASPGSAPQPDRLSWVL